MFVLFLVLELTLLLLADLEGQWGVRIESALVVRRIKVRLPTIPFCSIPH